MSGVTRGVFACGGAVSVAESDGGDVVAHALAESISFTESQRVAVSDGGGVVSG